MTGAMHVHAVRLKREMFDTLLLASIRQQAGRGLGEGSGVTVSVSECRLVAVVRVGGRVGRASAVFEVLVRAPRRAGAGRVLGMVVEEGWRSGGQRGETLERVRDGGGPGPVGGQVQREPAGVAGQAPGDVQ